MPAANLACIALVIHAAVVNAQMGPPPGGGGDNTLCDLDGSSSTYSEEITGSVRNIVASGCPNHNSQCFKVHCEDEETEAAVQDKNIEIPAYPCIATETFDVACIPDSIGITLNGVSLFSQWADQDCTDAVVAESSTFDACGGHAEPVHGTYHYHLAPACLLEQLDDAETPSENGHSPQIGWAYDGFPLYGPHGTDGQYIYPCTHDDATASDCLDECRGHSQHEIDGFTYHYHVTGPIGDLVSEPLAPVPGPDVNPYTIGCFRGVPSDWSLINTQQRTVCSDVNGYTEGYVPVAVTGVTEPHLFDSNNTQAPSTTMVSSTDVSSTTSTPAPSTTSTADAPWAHVFLFFVTSICSLFVM